MFVWIGLGSCGLGCVRVDWVGFVWIGLGLCGLGCVLVNWAVFVWNGLLLINYLNRMILPKTAT